MSLCVCVCVCAGSTWCVPRVLHGVWFVCVCRKYILCSMCRFATSCSFAYASHMMGFHSGQASALSHSVPWERPMALPLYCLCGFSSKFGNRIGQFQHSVPLCFSGGCLERGGGCRICWEKVDCVLLMAPRLFTVSTDWS